jgi:hypothetical protein
MKARQHWLRKICWVFFKGLFSLCASPLLAQQPVSSAHASLRALPQQGIYLVFSIEKIRAAPRFRRQTDSETAN